MHLPWCKPKKVVIKSSPFLRFEYENHEMFSLKPMSWISKQNRTKKIISAKVLGTKKSTGLGFTHTSRVSYQGRGEGGGGNGVPMAAVVAGMAENEREREAEGILGVFTLG